MKRMKKVMIMLLVFSLVVGCFLVEPVHAAKEVPPKISVKCITGNSGEVKTIKLKIKNKSDKTIEAGEFVYVHEAEMSYAYVEGIVLDIEDPSTLVFETKKRAKIKKGDSKVITYKCSTNKKKHITTFVPDDQTYYEFYVYGEKMHVYYYYPTSKEGYYYL